MIRVLSIHWGFSIGGVAQYAALLEGVSNYAPVKMSTVCILNRRRHIDEQTLSTLGNLTVFERKGVWDLRWLIRTRKLVKDGKQDLIFTHGFNGHFAALVTRAIGRKSVKYIASYHGKYHPPTRLKRMVAGLYNWFTEYYMRNIASSVVSVAKYCKRYLVANKVDPDKVTVIHNGLTNVVENEDAGILRAELGVPENRLVIGVISRLDPEKGITYLMEAFHDVVDGYPDAYLVLIGTGTQDNKLRQLASDLKIENDVAFAGFRAGAARYLAALDVFVLPSLAEYHSIGLLEAMRAGKAIVATDVGGNTESVRHGKEGLVVAPADPEGLENALKKLASSKELRNQLGQAASERFKEKFNVEVMVKSTAEWLVKSATA